MFETMSTLSQKLIDQRWDTGSPPTLPTQAATKEEGRSQLSLGWDKAVLEESHQERLDSVLPCMYTAHSIVDNSTASQ